MNYNFKLIEEKVEKIWKKNQDNIKKSTSFDPKKKLFSFLEGPPTANAPPALHHLEARFFKDLVCRYRFMQGFTVPRKGGWDCHGLPVEVQVEKKLNLGTKKDVVKFGIEKFNKECRVDVFTFINEWRKFTEKMGYWIDLDNPYITLTNEYIESVWWSLKELYKKGLLYEGFKVVPWCPRCETALSSHEVSLGYEKITEDTITVKFKQKGKNRYFLAWTTTPWTLPSNLALAVNPKLNYVIVKKNDEEYILSENRIENYFENPEIIEKIKGKDLEGIEYEPLFDYFLGKLEKPAWRILLGDFVTDVEGTGTVHIAPAFGEDDYNICKENDFAFVNPVSKHGEFLEDVTDFKKLSIFEANKKITKFLEEKNLLFSTEKYTHDYPFCWRCENKLMYYATTSWFIAVSKHRKQLLENNKKINWYPEHIKKGRFGKWLEEVRDWALSRMKFWGTALPIWRCECGNEECIGSIDELRKKGINVPKEIDLHKPIIDDIKLKCKCGKEMVRVSDVIDCWYDSGAATFAQFHYPFENKEMFEKSFPYDFIAEGVDQTRGWFYTLHVLGVLLFDKPSYKSVDCAGHVVDEKGEKMSKSKGNIIDPWDIFSKYGADAARLVMCTAAPGNPKKIGLKTIERDVIPFLNIVWNSYLFTKESVENQDVKGKEQVEDKWIISRTNSLISEIGEHLEKHEYNFCYSKFQNFVMEDLSRWYIKLVRKRFGEEVSNKTLLKTFDTLSRLTAPFTPYFSDFIYSDLLKNKESVHFTSWPKLEKKSIDKELEEQMEIVKKIVEGSNAERQERKIKLRYPLLSLNISGNEKTIKAVKNLKQIIEKMANVKEVKIEKLEQDYELKPNYASLGKKFEKDTKKIVSLLKEKDAKELKKELDKKGKIKLDKFTLVKEDLIFRPLGKGREFEGGRLVLDLTMSDELKKEWLLRELIRNIQEKRKQLGLKVTDKIKLYVSEEFKKFKKTIEKETGSKIIFGEGGEKAGFEFENKKHEFGIEKDLKV